MRFDISEIGAINLTLDFDEDFYTEDGVIVSFLICMKKLVLKIKKHNREAVLLSYFHF